MPIVTDPPNSKVPSCRHIALMGWDFYFLILKLIVRNGSVLTTNAWWLSCKCISAAIQGSVLWTQQKGNSSLSCSLHSFLFHLRFLSYSEPVPKGWENWKMCSVATALHQLPKSAAQCFHSRFDATWTPLANCANVHMLALLCPDKWPFAQKMRCHNYHPHGIITRHFKYSHSLLKCLYMTQFWKDKKLKDG